VACRDDGLITAFEEKPAQPAGNLANAGLYLARRALLDEIPRTGAVVDFGRDVLPRLAGRMRGFLIDGYLVDMGTAEGLAEAERVV
jgi:NDP-sugar pyrophosphorylase family protein